MGEDSGLGWSGPGLSLWPSRGSMSLGSALSQTPQQPPCFCSAETLPGLGMLVSPSSSAPPSVTPWISHLQGEDRSFSVFPKVYYCHFPFGTCGVSLLGPCYETETKGASPSYTLLLSPAWVLPAGLLGRLLGKYQALSAVGQRAVEERGRGARLQRPRPASFSAQASPCWQLSSPLPLQPGLPYTPRLMMRMSRGLAALSCLSKPCCHPRGMAIPLAS